MALTAVPASPADPDDFDAFHREFEATRAAFEEVRGHDVKLSAEARVLDSILSVAISHDTVVQHYEDRLEAQLGLRGDRQPFQDDDSRVNDHAYAVVELCASLAAAALRRVPTTPAFTEIISTSDAIGSLQGEDLEGFMRPIFEESGIGERFEVRTGHQVYLDSQPESARPN